MHKTPRSRNRNSRHYAHLLKWLMLTFLLVAETSAATWSPWVEQALSPDPSVAGPAIASLRAAGQDGVDALREAQPETAEGRERWRHALDTVCAQYDCADSGLYWYTDLDAARAEARRTGKPILSLRLLGRLDEDVSCANSRFFRTALYPDPKVAALLRDRFVLHWSSERPVPVIRIDFGDGRTLAGTITGNSAHYVLDADGRVQDALPGLYGAGLFVRRLRETADWYAAQEGQPPLTRSWSRAVFHSQRLSALEIEFAGFATAHGLAPAVSAGETGADADGAQPSARLAAERAMTKSLIEVPWVNALSSQTADLSADSWRSLAREHSEDWRLSDESRRFLLRKHGVADPVTARRAVEGFEDALGIDTLRNEYRLHAEIHRWLSDSEADDDFETVNARVYSELFLTPASDPWLGLSSPETYLALDPVAPSSSNGR